MGEIIVRRAGPLTTVQDLGRAGRRSAGVSSGGALDLFAARVSNLLVGNREEEALLEITLGGFCGRFRDDRKVAWSGGEFTVRRAGEEVPAGRPAVVRAGEEIEFEMAQRGGRAWLAISGGINLPAVLGSRATDLRAGFGGLDGRRLRDRDRLSLGAGSPVPENTPPSTGWSAPAEWVRTAARRPVLRVVRGAEWDDFTPETQADFFAQEFAVTSQADRMGARLAGPLLERSSASEMISEAVAPGAVQVANDGQPILLLGDCQTLGGYPRIAHVITVDLPVAAQLRPNDAVRFREIAPAAATALFRERDRDLGRFRTGLALRRG